jgi:TonB family protein
MTEREPGTSPNAHFLRTDALTASAPAGPLEGALSLSVLTHTFGFLLLALAISHLPDDGQRSTTTSDLPAQIVWLPQSGAPSGGGGSGHDRPEPPRRAELPGRDALTVTPIKGTSSATDGSRIDQEVDIRSVPMMSGMQELPGLVTTLPLVSTDSLGPGTGERAGDGNGAGNGPGGGQGEGPGRDRGMGGEAYRIGTGVVAPRLIEETKPAYTADAMRARIQGVVGMEAVVRPDGSVGRVRIIRSLDTTFGLDNEALAAVKRWRFTPGTLGGRAVPVLVNIELAFTLR